MIEGVYWRSTVGLRPRKFEALPPLPYPRSMGNEQLNSLYSHFLPLSSLLLFHDISLPLQFCDLDDFEW